jgi:Ca-activated chloride channel family protein
MCNKAVGIYISTAAAVFFLVLWTAPLKGQQPTASPQQQRPRRVATPPAGTSGTNKNSGTETGGTSQGDEVGDDDVVRVDTQLVSVPAVVSDTNGRPVANLRAENFVLYEDNAAQRISNFATTDVPFEVALLLDTSGSTREDVTLIKGAAKAFIDQLRSGDRVALAAFNTSKDESSKLAEVEVLSDLTSDRQALQTAVERIGASNGTPFYDSLVKIADEVFKSPPSPEMRGRRALVALTDGVDSSSNAEYAEAKEKLERAGIACYFIQVNTEDFVEDRLLSNCQSYGALMLSRTQLKRYRAIYSPKSDARDFNDFCSMGQFERMQISRSLYTLARNQMADLAKISGGKTFEAAEIRDARAAFSQVAREIGTQYSLGYYPTNKARDGQYRKIRIVVKGVNGKPLVRAREGYYAPRS